MKYDLEICMLSLFRPYQRCVLFSIFLSSLLLKISVGFIGFLGIKLSLQLWACGWFWSIKPCRNKTGKDLRRPSSFLKGRIAVLLLAKVCSVHS